MRLMSNEEVMALRVDPAALGDHLEEFAQRVRLVSLMARGVSARKALEHIGIKRTPAWATKLFRRFRQFGEKGLLDLRKYNGAKQNVMTLEVQNAVMKVWHTYPAAGAPKVHAEAKKVCQGLGLPIPSASTVKAYLESLPEAVKMTRGGQFAEYDKQARTTLPTRFTKYANQRFQADHTRLDIWARHLVDGKWVPVEVWLTALLDDYSRAIAGIAMTKDAANSWSITRALRHAFLPKQDARWAVHGTCEVFQCDRGADFMSHAITAALGVLGVMVDPDPPHYPNRKGKVERWSLTLDHGCLRGLPGHMGAIGTSRGAAEKNIHKLLTPEQIEAEITEWIVTEYHTRTHSKTNRRPIDLWEETVHLRTSSDDDVFRALVRMEDKVRTVQPVIEFTRNDEGGLYWCPELLEHYGRSVKVAYNPEDMRRIAVFCDKTDEFLGEPWLLGHAKCPYSEDDVRRHAANYRRGLQSRIERHLNQAEAARIEANATAEWDAAREQVTEIPAVPAEQVDPEEAEVENVLKSMSKRRSARRRPAPKNSRSKESGS